MVKILIRDGTVIPFDGTQKIIEKGYAGNQTEVIRQAILAYERMLDEEELQLVHKAVKLEMEEIKSGKIKNYGLDEIKKIYDM